MNRAKLSGLSALAAGLAGLAIGLPALAAPPAMTRDEIVTRGNGVVGFSYWWGHGRWSTSSGAGHGSCSGSCPSCSHSGSYGADCSGFVAKAWQVPSTISVSTDAHPYSTWHFTNQSTHWGTISRSNAKKADAFVYNSGSAGHMFLYVSGDPWGWVTAIECKGCSYGCVKGGRSISSSYKAIRRDNVQDVADKDGDGVSDPKDNCPSTKNASQKDTDSDGKGDACDSDDDADGISDGNDNCPTKKNASQLDTDQDGKGDACDSDDDDDGVTDDQDNCDKVQNKGQLDTDKDGKGDACDDDDDGDGLVDGSDNCPTVKNAAQLDTDQDGKGDACEEDDDGDGVIDAEDNCPTAPNGDQLDTDKDTHGDECDDDDDEDGIADGADNCPEVHGKEQTDTDGDGAGDVCDLDLDGDGTPNADDLCPAVKNVGQDDSDGDGVGDECDDDGDGDGVFDTVDNCPTVYNPDQKVNAAGLGEACGSGDLGDPTSYGGVEPEAETDGSPVEGGCGCRAAGARPDRELGGVGLLALALLGLVSRRARRP